MPTKGRFAPALIRPFAATFSQREKGWQACYFFFGM